MKNFRTYQLALDFFKVCKRLSIPDRILKLAKKYAEQLNFKYFLAQILHIEKSVKILKQKYSNNIQLLF